MIHAAVLMLAKPPTLMMASTPSSAILIVLTASRLLLVLPAMSDTTSQEISSAINVLRTVTLVFTLDPPALKLNVSSVRPTITFWMAAAHCVFMLDLCKSEVTNDYNLKGLFLILNDFN